MSSTTSITTSDPPPHSFSSTSTLPQPEPPEPISSSTVAPLDHQATLYVQTILASPHAYLSTFDARLAFLDALLGPTSLADNAINDPPLLLQLETRTTIVISTLEDEMPHAPLSLLDIYIALLATLATQWPLLLAVMERRNVTTLVIDTLSDHTTNPSIVSRCLSCLRTFTVTDTMRKRVMYDGALDVILFVMQTHHSHHRIQDRSFAVLANIAFGCAHRKRRITRQGGVIRIVNAMKTFPVDEHIQLRGALAIRNLTHQAQVNQFIAGNQGAVQAVAAALLRFRGGRGKPEMRFQCVLALDSLCREDERNRQRVFDIDTTARLAPANVPHVAPKQNPRERRRKVEERLNEDGDVVVEEEEVLLPYGQTHFRHGAALYPGKSSTTLFTSPSVSSSAGSEKVSDSGALHLEFTSPERDAERTKPSLLRTIIHCLRRDPDDAMLLESGISLLTFISLNRPDAQLRIGQLGAVQLAVAAMRRHRKNDMLVARACALIRCLCLQQVNRSKITSGLPVLISAARDHYKESDIVREIASALSNAVFENEKNRAWVVDKGGIQAIVRAISEGGAKDVMVLEAGIVALRNFVDASNEGALSAANEGAVRAALDALDLTKDAKNRGQRIVQEQAVMFLVDISRLAPQTQQMMHQMDAEDWIENALAKLPQQDYEELHESGDKLITALSYLGGSKFGSRSANRPISNTPPSPTNISHRSRSRGLFGGFSLTRRKQRQSWQGRKGLMGRNTPSHGESRTKRLSARFMKSSSRSHG